MDEFIREHLVTNLSKGMRSDGRSTLDYRKITIEEDVSATAEGSVKVSIGDTVVIAGVKLGLEEPFPDTPEQGNLMVNVELLPLSSPLFEQGPPSAESIEVARVTDRGIRESHMIDVEKLCVKKGEQVWSVTIDICTLNHAGNLLDAASLAAVAALRRTRLPKIVDGKVEYKTKTEKMLPIEHLPVSITVHKIGDHLIVDPAINEETNSDARLTVCSLEDGTICALQKGGSTPLMIDQVYEMLDLAIAQAKESRKSLE